MPRPVKCRNIGCNPDFLMFKPAGIPSAELDEVVLSFDEFEAIRLADYEGLYHVAAALQMQVSRQTFGNILASARHKVSAMLILGKKLTVTGGNIMVRSNTREFGCACGHEWSVGHGIERPVHCPSCNSETIHRQSADGGSGGGGRGGAGRCRGLRSGLHRQGKEQGNANRTTKGFGQPGCQLPSTTSNGENE